LTHEDFFYYFIIIFFHLDSNTHSVFSTSRAQHSTTQHGILRTPSLPCLTGSFFDFSFCLVVSCPFLLPFLFHLDETFEGRNHFSLPNLDTPNYCFSCLLKISQKPQCPEAGNIFTTLSVS